MTKLGLVKPAPEEPQCSFCGRTYSEHGTKLALGVRGAICLDCARECVRLGEEHEADRQMGK